MRSKLENLKGSTQLFTAGVGRVCTCTGHRVDTALLINVYSDAGEFLADHAWIKLPRQLANKFNRLPLGATIKFQATVGEYIKQCGDKDFSLNNVVLED